MTALIYTRLQEFWPDDECLILLAPWYLPPYDPDARLNFSTLSSPWNNYAELEKAFDYTNQTYEHLIDIISGILNDIHNTSYPTKYWRIIVGPWLLWFVNVVYDRYVRITDAVRQCPEIKINGLDSSCYIIPHNALDFVQRAKHDDAYNMQLITKLLGVIGHKPYKNIYTEQADDLTDLYISNKNITFRSVIRNVISFIEQVCVKFLLPYSRVLFFRSYFENSFLNRLFFFSSGKFLKIDNLKSHIIKTDINIKQRNSLKQKCKEEKSSNLLSDIIIQLIPSELPKVYLEGYELVRKGVEKDYGKVLPKALVSATGWYFEENFKFWAAGLQYQGVKLVGIQHGGNYGLVRMCGDDHEYEIADDFLTWGWSKQLKNCKIIPAFYQKTINTHREQNKNYEKILYVSTSPCRNLINFPWIPELSLSYLEFQNNFFSSLNDVVQRKISVRPHYQDDTWEIKKNLKRNFPNLLFENWELPFQKSLKESRIVVTDYISTTFIESLAANIPTVLFFDPSINILEKDPKELFDKLFTAKIIHYSPQSAADWINEIYDSVDEWWFSEELQCALQKFCAKYFRSSHFSLSDWFNIFKKLG